MKVTITSMLVFSLAGSGSPEAPTIEEERAPAAVQRQAGPPPAPLSGASAADTDRDVELSQRQKRRISSAWLEWQAGELERLEMWHETQRLMGERRLRNVDEARFHLHRMDIRGSELDDDPATHERVTKMMRHSVLGAGRHYLEEKIGWAETEKRLEDRLESWWRQRRDRSRGQSARPSDQAIDDEPDAGSQGLGLHYSPQINLDRDPALGVKLRLRSDSESPLLRHSSFLVRQRLDSGCLMMRLKYQHRNVFFSLEQGFGDERRGDYWSLSFRTSF